MTAGIEGRRIAIAGMGRSGLAIARACVSRGALPTVYDEKPCDDETIIQATDQLQAMGAVAVSGWHGRLDPTEHDMLVASPGFRREHAAIGDMLAGGKEVVSEVEFAFRIAHAPIIAITGTNGKSTTTVLTWLLLRAAGVDAVLCGNIAGSGYEELTLTDAASQASPQAVLVAEISSYQLEWVREFRPKVATITNVTPDHLDRHPNFEDYFGTKLRILSAMGEGDRFVWDAQEPSLPFERIRAALSPDAQLVTVNSPDSSTRIEERGSERYIVLRDMMLSAAALRLLFAHQCRNAVLAWELACSFLDSRSLGVPASAMLAALYEFRGLTHRLEWIGARNGVQVINNSMCTNPAAVIASTAALHSRQRILMGGQTKGLDFAPVRDYLATRDDVVYLFGADCIRLAQVFGERAKCFDSMEDAFQQATRDARPGDLIVLSPGCRSSHPYADFMERGQVFTRMAKEWLRS